MRISIFLIYCMSVILFSCSDSTSPSDDSGKIRVRVLNVKDMQPISEVLIKTEPPSHSVLTSDKGEVLLSNVENGDYVVTAEKLGFIKNSTTVKVRKGETAQADILLYDESYNNNLPDKPILLTPSNNSTIKKLTTNLTWSCTDKDNDELFYTVFFDTVNPPVKIAASDISLTSLKIDGLIQNNTYYWYVVAKDKYGIGPKSSVYSFKVDTNITIIPDDNLVLHLPFDNNFNDASNNKLQTTCSNPIYSTDRKGNLNSSFACLNKNTVTVKYNSAIDFTNNFTVSFWINPNSGYGFDMLTDLAQIVGRFGATGVNTSSWSIDLNSQGNVIFQTYNNSNQTSDQLSNTNLKVGEWTHVCITYSNGTVKFYFNGLFEKLASISHPQTSSYDLHIGGRVTTNNRFLNSYLDKMKIFNKVLNDEEIYSLFNE